MSLVTLLICVIKTASRHCRKRTHITDYRLMYRNISSSFLCIFLEQTASSLFVLKIHSCQTFGYLVTFKHHCTLIKLLCLFMIMGYKHKKIRLFSHILLLPGFVIRCIFLSLLSYQLICFHPGI